MRFYLRAAVYPPLSAPSARGRVGAKKSPAGKRARDTMGKKHLHCGGNYAKLFAYMNTVRVESGRRRRRGRGRPRGDRALEKLTPDVRAEGARPCVARRISQAKGQGTSAVQADPFAFVRASPAREELVLCSGMIQTAAGDPRRRMRPRQTCKQKRRGKNYGMVG